MGSYVVTDSGHARAPSRLYLSVAGVVAAAVLAVAIPAYQARVTAAGSTHAVGLSATVADLVAADVLRPRAGDLVDVTGGVLEPAAGNPAVFFVNGRKASLDAVLRDGDRVSVRPGNDVVEGTETTTTPIPIELVKTGKGPLVALESPGSVGVLEYVVGSLSGKTVSTRVLEPAEPMVVRRWVPDSSTRVVALTFDDGPWPGQTDRVLDILAEHDVRATFFVVGRLVERHPGIARRIVEDGHLIGNHTQSHAILTSHDGAGIRREIAEGTRSIREVTGVTPQWFRPPGGRMNPTVLSETERMGMDLVLWDVDPQDWRRPDADRMLTVLLSGIRPGSIVLLHDGGGDRSQTVAVLPRLIEELKARGYLFVTLDQLR
ncbi:MAG TPA: polysaccharide deacetylase family protein [Coriobacteriia bacterium]|nr:polysaccharide deacetylase family protein [Coriobacteriia bacterium]